MVQYVRRGKHAKGEKTKMIMAAIAKQKGSFGARDIQKACPDASNIMIRKVLFGLKIENKLKLTGRARSSVWEQL
ncbi:MAG: hypothetical protein WC838_03155 [Candidatus Margulisiibacteriota bacterium]|jgi:hypothetical protein